MFTKNLKITKISKRPFKGKVYNFSVEGDESYFANGISAHNCRGIWVSISKTETDKPKVSGIPDDLRACAGKTLSEFKPIKKPVPLEDGLAYDYLKRQGKI